MKFRALIYLSKKYTICKSEFFYITVSNTLKHFQHSFSIAFRYQKFIVVLNLCRHATQNHNTWHIFKHFQTFSNILKHSQTFSNVLKRSESFWILFWTIDSEFVVSRSLSRAAKVVSLKNFTVCQELRCLTLALNISYQAAKEECTPNV